MVNYITKIAKILVLLALLAALSIAPLFAQTPINSSYWFKETLFDNGGDIKLSDSLLIGWDGSSFLTIFDTTGHISLYGGASIPDNYVLKGVGGLLALGAMPPATLSGLNPYQVLTADADGNLFQTPNFQWSDEFGSDMLSITGTFPQITVSEGSNSNTLSSQALYLANGTGAATEIKVGSFRIYDDDGGSVSLSKYDNNTAASYNLVFPPDIGSIGQSLRLDASLNFEWFTPGSVTSFSFTDGNGFDGTVTNSTTTPTLSLTTTVSDNQVMISNSGAIGGSSLFTYDDTPNAEAFNATIQSMTISGTSNYPSGLFQIDDVNGQIYIGDLAISNNGTVIQIDDNNHEIFIEGITSFLHLAGVGDKIYYLNNNGQFTELTLTANDFDFSAPTLSLDYTNGQKANGSQPGFLSSADWTTFNSKAPSNAEYVVSSADANLSNEDVLTEGSAIDLTNGASTLTIDLDINELTTETLLNPDDKALLYDASEAANNKVEIEELSAYVNKPHLRDRRFTYYNEFINIIGTATGGNDITSTNSGTGAGTSNTATNSNNRVGLVRSTTGTTATGRTSPSSASNSIRLGGGVWTYEVELNIAALSTSGERYQLVVGFFDVQSAANQVDAVAFVYDEGGVSTGSAASANWQQLTSSNSTRTWTTTGTAVSTAWTNLKIEINASASTVTYYINGTSTGTTHTTNIPAASNRELGFGWLLIKSVGTTARVVDFDYVYAECDFTTTR